jgi:LysM repeat protein
MDDSTDKEMNELMEEMAEELDYTANDQNNAHTGKPVDSKNQRKVFALWGGVILLLIVLVALLFAGSDEVDTERPSPIQTRLEQVEERLRSFEGMDQRIANLEKLEQGLRASIAKADAHVQSLAEQLDKIAQEVKKLEDRPAPVAAEAESPPPVQATKPPESEARYHVVRSGDSLYSIGRKYGISVEELRRLNNIPAKQAIYPGQKLMIAEGSNQ